MLASENNALGYSRWGLQFTAFIMLTHQPIVQGHTKPECAQKFPEKYSKYASGLRADATHHTVKTPEGECRADMLKRGMSCLDEICAAHKGETILVVSHGAMLDTLIRHILGISGWETNFMMKNTSVTTLVHNADSNGEWKVKTLGDVVHQEGEWGAQLLNSSFPGSAVSFSAGFAAAAALFLVATRLFGK
jgi:broad specificity phosphatase PhoE